MPSRKTNKQIFNKVFFDKFQSPLRQAILASIVRDRFDSISKLTEEEYINKTKPFPLIDQREVYREIVEMKKELDEAYKF